MVGQIGGRRAAVRFAIKNENSAATVLEIPIIMLPIMVEPLLDVPGIMLKT